MPNLYEVHPPGPSGAPPSTAPIVVTPPVFEPGAGTGTGGSNNPYTGDNYEIVQTGNRTRSFRLVYATGNHAVDTASSDYTYPVVGMLIVKQGSSQGVLQKEGRVAQVMGLTPGQRYFLGLDGTVVAPPFAVGAVHYVQQVGYALDDGTLYLQPTGIVYERDTSQGGEASPDGATIGSGKPDVNEVYPTSNVYIDRQTGDWYSQPVDSGTPSKFYVGDGAPSSIITYPTMAVYVDKNTGGYYFKDASSNTYVPVSSGEGAPTNGGLSAYRTIYIDQTSGDAYYGDS